MLSSEHLLGQFACTTVASYEVRRGKFQEKETELIVGEVTHRRAHIFPLSADPALFRQFGELDRTLQVLIDAHAIIPFVMANGLLTTGIPYVLEDEGHQRA